jgi:hypothetical protein
MFFAIACVLKKVGKTWKYVEFFAISNFPVESRDDDVEHCDDEAEGHRRRVHAMLVTLA